jgi:hypothetical protein
MAVKPKLPKAGLNKHDEGQLKGNAQPDKFADPRETREDYGRIDRMDSKTNDIGEYSGFETEGYIVKKGMGYGENLKLNYLPPGMDITNQENCDMRDMPYKEITDLSYPGDGWEPSLKKGA